MLGDDEAPVYPDLPAASRVALAVRQGRFRDEARRTRGRLGLGTDFESIRDYQPDDDIRHVNWAATQRVGRPMSNQYRGGAGSRRRLRDGHGRLMVRRWATGTRLDFAVDAATAMAAVADELGDRCGVVAFDGAIRRRLPPRRKAARGIVAALFDLEPTAEEATTRSPSAASARSKRAFVLVLTDLLDQSAARPLVDAMPVLARRHHVVVASAATASSRRCSTPSPPGRSTSIARSRRRRCSTPASEPRGLSARPAQSSSRPPRASSALPASSHTSAPRPEHGL